MDLEEYERNENDDISFNYDSSDTENQLDDLFCSHTTKKAQLC